MLAFLVFFPLFLVVYHLALFPLGLMVAAKRRGRRDYPIPPIDQLPTVELMIAARNESSVIEAKLRNTLELDYPKEKLHISVLANGCEDDTPDIVRRYAQQGIVLIEEGAIGKTEAQNRAVAASNAEIIVFSDANTFYNREAILHLVAPFLDPQVGAVSGRHLYVNREDPTGAGEGVYWNDIETRMKQAESDLSGLIGANGSIYAVRRDLYEPLAPEMMSDFIEPLVIAMRGYRTVFAPKAVSSERSEATFEREYVRKARIVALSFHSLLNTPGALNPRRSGSLAFLLFSHKILRWFTPPLLLLATIAAMLRMVSGSAGWFERWVFISVTLFGFLAMLGRGLGMERKIPVLTHAYYVFLMFRAATQGVYEALTKGVPIVWDPARSNG